MKKQILAAAAAVIMGAGALMAEVPSTLSGKWISGPVTDTSGPAKSVTEYILEFVPGTSECDYLAKVNLTGMQMGSNMMKINACIDVAGRGTWTIEGDKLVIKFADKAVTATVDPATVDLDIPEAMKTAMAARMDEFMGGITGGLEDGFAKAVNEKGATFDRLDVDPATPDTMTAQDDGIAVTFTRK